MLTSSKRLLLLPCALISLAAGPLKEIDATQVPCAQFQEYGLDRQRRILSFLQGYARRDVPQDKVGSVGIGVGLGRVLDACTRAPSAAVWAKVQELATGEGTAARGEARLTRPPTELTCKAYLKLDRQDQRLTVYWLDGYSRKNDPADANQSVVALDRDPEDLAGNACGTRKGRLWWAIQGSVRSVDPAPSG